MAVEMAQRSRVLFCSWRRPTFAWHRHVGSRPSVTPGDLTPSSDLRGQHTCRHFLKKKKIMEKLLEGLCSAARGTRSYLHFQHHQKAETVFNLGDGEKAECRMECIVGLWLKSCSPGASSASQVSSKNSTVSNPTRLETSDPPEIYQS